LGEGKVKQAETLADEALRRWPDRANLHLLRGYALTANGKLDEAEAAFRSALVRTDDPMERLSAHLGLGGVLEKLNRQKQADQQYAAAVQIYPELRDVLEEIESERLWPQSVYTDEYCSPESLGERLKKIEQKLGQRKD
jgi:tetratricopeptide (TPR) repeat protein